MGTASQRYPRIDAIGLSAALRRAIAADLPHHRIRHLPPSSRPDTSRARTRSRPALVIVDATATDARAEREAVWRRWGADLPVVEVNRATPIVRVWLAPTRVEVVELGPGFLAPYLPSQGLSGGRAPAAPASDRPTASTDRWRWRRDRLSFPVRLATAGAVGLALTALDRRLGLAMICAAAVVMVVAVLLRWRARMLSRG